MCSPPTPRWPRCFCGTRPAAPCPPTRRLAATLKLGITWQASALYAVTFGGYVAFSVYLPTYLKTGYGLTQADAANRMAGFVLFAVAMRPIGGWLSDRFGPVPVLPAALAVMLAGACTQSFTPSLAPVGTIAFLAMAAALGAGSRAVFAVIAALEDEHRRVEAVLAEANGPYLADQSWPNRLIETLDLLREHILKEPDGVFPAALALLDTEQWESVEAVRARLGTAVSEPLPLT